MQGYIRETPFSTPIAIKPASSKSTSHQLSQPLRLARNDGIHHPELQNVQFMHDGLFAEMYLCAIKSGASDTVQS
jgi:hypothetical protein